MNKHLLYLFILILAGCSQEKKKSSSVFFAGEIVNPTSKKVLLYKGNVALDSAVLNDNNRFSFEIPTIEEGMHYF